MRGAKVVATAGLVVSLVLSGPAWAARLRVIDKKEIQGGPAMVPKVTEQLANPDVVIVMAGLLWDYTVEAAGTAGCVSYVSDMVWDVLIEPDPGEEVGDPVTVRYEWGGGCATTVPDSHFRAEAHAGGRLPHNSCFPLAVSLDNGATIVLNPAGSATQVFESPIVNGAAPPNSNVTDQRSGSFDAVIGDVIGLRAAVVAGAEWDTLGTGIVGGSAGSSITLFIIGDRTVPALSWIGLGALALLLAVATVLALRRTV